MQANKQQRTSTNFTTTAATSGSKKVLSGTKAAPSDAAARKAVASAAATGSSGKPAAAAKQQANKDKVFIRIVTWNRDSHGLFDYESRDRDRVQLEFQSNTGALIQRNAQGVVTLENPFSQKEKLAQRQIQSAAVGLLRASRNSKTGTFEVAHGLATEEETSINRIWRVVGNRNEHLQSQVVPEETIFTGIRLNKFDVIKLGRMKFRIKELVCANQGNNDDEIRQQDLKEAHQVTFMEPNVDEAGNELSSAKDQLSSGDGTTAVERQSQASQCRFCWGTESSIENPCIVPCNCSGTVGFIHYACLKNWLHLKMQSKETPQITTLFWRNFECELCKYAYPYLFKTSDRVYRLVDIKTPVNSQNYVVMESLALEKNSSRTIHVMAFTDEHSQFTMGRGHESQVRVNDISVSRTHALLKFCKDDGIYLSDNKSKFGTLILMRQEAEQLKNSENYMYQIGRSVCSLRVVEKTDTQSANSDSFDQDGLSSAEHGQTEPFCSSQSSEGGDSQNPEVKRCQSSREAAALGHENTLMQMHTQNDRDSISGSLQQLSQHNHPSQGNPLGGGRAEGTMPQQMPNRSRRLLRSTGQAESGGAQFQSIFSQEAFSFGGSRPPQQRNQPMRQARSPQHSSDQRDQQQPAEVMQSRQQPLSASQSLQQQPPQQPSQQLRRGGENNNTDQQANTSINNINKEDEE